MKIDLDRLVPVPADAQNEAGWLGLGIGAAAAWNGFDFWISYANTLARLYREAGGQKLLLTGAQMAPFGDLIHGGATLFPVVLIGALGMAIGHYAGHYAGSKSVYLMRRLPDKWEFHRRCLGLPLLGVAAALAVLAAQTGLHYLGYLLITPEGCL